MIKKKSIALLLVFCIAIGILSACGGAKESSDSTTKSSSSAAPESTSNTTPESTATSTDPFPGADLGGVTIKVAGMQNPEKADEAKKEMWRDRQKEVEKKFNCKLVFDALEGVEWNDVPKSITTSLAAGEPNVDFGSMSRYYIADLMNNDAILDLTKDVEAYKFPKPYYLDGGQWAGKTVGFTTNPMLPWSALVYNRDMIKAAGMAKTPGEMFKEGKWSFTDFYNYCAELKTKLPKDVNVFGIHALNWARGAGYGNDATMMDPKTYVPTYTSDSFYEAVEALQKMVKDGLAVNATQITRDDGSIGYDWNKTQEGFTEGKLAISIGASWDFEGYASKLDYGIVPFPWGSNVTVKDNDYKTISDNYHSYYNDCGLWVVVKGSEKKATPEQYMNLLFSYMKEEGETLVKNREKEAKGEAITASDAGQPRNFTSDLDVELWDWYISRGKFDPLDTTAVSNVFYRALYKVCSTNENPRSAFESIVGQDTAALVEAKLVDPNNLSDELKKQMDTYKATAPKEEKKK